MLPRQRELLLKAPFDSRRRFGGSFLAVAALLAMIISAGGWFYYTSQYDKTYSSVQESLATIAGLKTEDIVNWMKERRGDAEVARMSVVINGVQADPNNAEMRKAALDRIQTFRRVYGYAAVVLANPQGEILLKDPADYPLPDSSVAEHIQIALHSEKPVVSDLHNAKTGDPVYLWISCPLISQSGTGVPVRGAVLLVVDPRKFLYPTVQQWPVPSQTAEAALLLDAGGKFEYLNEPRFKMEDTSPAAASFDSSLYRLATKGSNAIFEAKDYRGVPVIAALRKIPDTPWFLLVKADKAELLAPLYKEAWEAGIVTALLLLAATLGMSSLWRQKKVALLQVSETRLRTLIERAPVAISITRNGKGIYANQKCVDLYGYGTAEELLETSVVDRCVPESRSAVEERLRQLENGEPTPLEYEIPAQRKDGVRFTADVVVSPVELTDGKALLAFLTDITARKKAEEKLKLFRALVDHAHDAIEVIDPNTWRFLDVNEAASQIIGYTREEYLALTVFDIDPSFAAGGEAKAKSHLAEMQRLGAMVFESRHRRKDGSVFPVEINASYVRLERDYIFAVVRDITERNRTEEQIRQLNRVYAVLSNINELIVREKNSQALLQAACDIAVKTGQFQMAWIGMVDEDAQVLKPVASAGVVDGYLDDGKIDLNDSVRAAGPWCTALRTGLHQVCDDVETDPRMRTWREAAIARGYHSSAAFQLKVAGKAIGVIGLYANEKYFFDKDELRLLDELASDIGFALEVHRQEAERQNAVQSLQASERQFASTFEHAAIGMALVATDGRWLKVNHALSTMVGYTPEELCARNSREITHPDDRKKDAEFTRAFLAGEIETRQSEKRYIHKDGHTVWILLNVSLVRDDQGAPVHFISQIQDITESRKLAEQFRQSQKMEAIGQLAGGVAHDFNNILAVIMMQAELTTGVENIPEEATEGLRDILVASERAANLINQLLLFSRKQVMQTRDLDLNEVVTNLAKMLQRFIGEDVRLQLHLHHSPLVIHADAGMLDQVLMNLAVNARDAMPRGGKLIVETAEKTVDENFARLDPDAKPGRYVCLNVRDTGTGIPPDVLPRIFEPFFTTKEPGKGTGLGLATVFGIARQHRGFVNVESEVGEGTSFQIFLPASEAVLESLAGAAKSKPRGGTETILLVEDEEQLRSVMRIVLERYGYRVHEAADGVQAMSLWQEHNEQVALLITDLVMPAGVSGQELAGFLQQEKPQLKVIFMSGYSADIAGRHMELKSGENFLKKPVSPDLLLETIRKSLDG